MSNFTSIDLDALTAVSGGAGGADAPNQASTKASTNVGVTYKGTQVGVQGSYETSTAKTNPAQCASDVREAGGSAAQVLDCFKMGN